VTARERAAPPLETYGLLGDTRSAALVSAAGDVDWWCLPRFDSSPVCGRLVGGPGAGHLALGPAHPAVAFSRGYLDGAPVLQTRWQHGAATLTLTEGDGLLGQGAAVALHDPGPQAGGDRRHVAGSVGVRAPLRLAARAATRTNHLRRSDRHLGAAGDADVLLAADRLG
jgi:hypothetical protein